ncbi:oligosaccharide flippase family protein [Pararhodobacter oceanensis]|uniref:Polysaccharide biosynthesis protein n=1 Tax=Pararhodobacter oceanensis TaxID=2172121 RepID=A0A2T8HSC2_9RHOB|nr:oligosaccharide flippase family protein [Pararhodobacter oceanensis]PVH28336.1 polysaccharide biosynthesis protein [Pararhodobacter oceanensis]
MTTPEIPGGLMRRIMRSSAFTIVGFGTQQVIRFGSNLILARLLFPEAFGTMALVTVLLVGLTMLSDLGIQPAIQSSKHGDEPDFLNTAWTLNMIRAVVLFLSACALAWPMAWFYGEPLLMQLIPVAAISMLLLALSPTRAEVASRHMALGRVTLMEVSAQLISVTAMLILAWLTGSIWALIAGNLVAAAARASLAWIMLPGISNRLHLDRVSARELIRYGRWIFFSTMAGFIVLQSDKLILGHFLTMEQLGLYNIGFFLAGFPLMLGQLLVQRLMIPIYRASPPSASAENFARLRRIRFLLSAMLFAGVIPLALGGLWIVDFLYDARYYSSGAVTTLVSVALLPQMLGLTYDQVALASGDSRGFFLLNACRAVLLVTLLLTLVPMLGVPGAPLAMAATALLSYPLQLRLARKYGAWDGLHDGVMALAALALMSVVWLLHGETLAQIFAQV